MDERLRFVARLLDGEKMAPLCREFGISRVTGHKLFNRFKECGLEAFKDRSRRPYRHANKLVGRKNIVRSCGKSINVMQPA
jgi:putative transposase